MLARREHSVFELRQKLALKGWDDTVAEAVIAELTAAGLQSDTRFAESFVRSRIERGLGPVRIAQELRQRGIDTAVTDEFLDRADPAWYERCRDVARRRFGNKPPRDWRERGQRARFLQYRGFSSGQIAKAFGGTDEADDEFYDE